MPTTYFIRIMYVYAFMYTAIYYARRTPRGRRLL